MDILGIPQSKQDFRVFGELGSLFVEDLWGGVWPWQTIIFLLVLNTNISINQ